jgi:hypothetical protein
MHPLRRRRRILISLAAAGIIVLGLAGAGVIWWNQRGPSRPSLSRAVDRFRSSDSTAAIEAKMQPTPGVYIYAGTGAERLSFMAAHQSQDGNLPGTVTRDANGCWSFAIDYNSFHRETWHRCPTAGGLVERGNTTEQKFDFGPLSQSERTEVVCRPPTTIWAPGTRPGHREPLRCRGHSEATKTDMTQRGWITFVGRTTVLVGSSRVPALRYTQDIEVGGDQSGTTHEAVWIAEKNGLPLREERTISVVSPAPAPLNHVTYTENGRWQLTSLTPRT